MFNNLLEEDFAALRGPFDSGRQSPSAFGGILMLSVFLQGLMFTLTYVAVGGSTYFPNKTIISIIHLVITVIFILLAIIFSIPSVYMKYQKAQYFLSILISQNLFGVYFYVAALFLIGSDLAGGDQTIESLMTLTYVTLIIGILIFVTTFIRFYKLLQKGEYRKDSKKDSLRGRFETKSYVPIAIIGGLGIVYIIQHIARNTYTVDVNMITIILIGPLLFYAMLFVLPEQLVILYCKHRFESFNYDQKGNLKPLGTRKGA